MSFFTAAYAAGIGFIALIVIGAVIHWTRGRGRYRAGKS